MVVTGAKHHRSDGSARATKVDLAEHHLLELVIERQYTSARKILAPAPLNSDLVPSFWIIWAPASNIDL